MKRHLNGMRSLKNTTIRHKATHREEVVTVSKADRDALRSAYEEEQAATSAQQSIELRMKADLMVAQARVVEAAQKRAEIMNRLGREYDFDASRGWNFDMKAGTLTVYAAPVPVPPPSRTQ